MNPLDGAPNLDLDQTALLGLALGYVIPLIVAAVIRSHWRPEVKTALALLVSAAASVATLAVRGQLDATNGTRLTLAVVAMSAYFYRMWWRKSGVTEALELRNSDFGVRSNPLRNSDCGLRIGESRDVKIGGGDRTGAG